MLSARLITALSLAAAATHAQDVRILVFTQTLGHRHDSIPAALATVQNIAAASCLTAEFTEDSSQFNPANLARFRAVVFLLTSGDVLAAPEEQAFESWFRAGGGWVGVHSAADTEYSWPFSGQLLGGEHFASHPGIQPATIIIEDPTHASTIGLPALWSRTDEWYNFQVNPRPVVQVLARLDESTYAGGTMGDHPIAWHRTIDTGRAWYTAGGHTIESYSEPHFVAHIRGGILWAAATSGCTCYPNCEGTTTPPVLTANDFQCFINAFAAGHSYANCDGSTGSPALAAIDFQCFINAFAAGCS